MRILLSSLVIMALVAAETASGQVQRPSSRTIHRHARSARPHNTAREYQERRAGGISARANRSTGFDWKQRLAQARRMQYENRYGRPVNGPQYVDDDSPYWAYDEYYGSIYGNPNVYGYGNGYYGQPPVAWDPESYADVFLDKREYANGPNGPGYYTKEEWYRWSIAQRRSEQLLEANQAGVDQGMNFFRAGSYDRAAVAWLNASTYDQGDAASRIHAGTALFALGRYDEAVRLLARGFELAPQLVGASFDIRNDYVRQDDFTAHFNRLKTHVAQQPNDLAGLAMMGYVLSYTDGPSHAYPFLQRAHAIAPQDTFIQKLWEIAEKVGPAPSAPGAYQPQPQIQPQAPAPRNPMGQMRPIPSSPPNNGGRNQGVNQTAPAPKPEKMRLVRADDAHR